MKLFALTVILALSTVMVAAQGTTPAPEAAARVVAELARTSSSAVKNAPFSADEVNESVQTLADGNRIVRSSTGKIYRNSEGRTRREMSGGFGGVLGSTYTVAPSVSILDPVAGFHFKLDTHLKTAQQSVLQATEEIRVRALSDAQRAAIERNGAMDAAEKAKIVERMKVELEKVAQTVPPIAPVPAVPPVTVVTGQGGIAGGFGATTVMRAAPAQSPKYDTRTEDLGTQSMEGVEVTGTRTTTTIPAGAIGNERPIEIVYEKWYSPELKVTVMSRHSDPRFGEQTYRLTNINRSEPDPSLFSVNGYRVVNSSPKAAATFSGTQARKPVKATTVKNP
jgi:hypothetical protein